MKDFKKDFPLLNKSDIAYLDSGATAQKPQCVIDAVEEFYKSSNANAYRGAYKLSVSATEQYNNAREKVAFFLNAKFPEDIIFTKNATESLNLIAYSYGLDNIGQNDRVVLSIMEHHSNLVPWQKVTSLKKGKLEYMYLDDNFLISKEEIDKKITNGVKIVGIVTTSNVLGSKNDVSYIIKKAHSVGAVVVVDASQSIAHEKLDVQKLDADFVVFSGHKMYAPLGVGVLYGKKGILEKMSPFLMGGDMIEYVYEQSTTFAPLPHKFEAGTQNVAGAVGLASAIDYLENVGFDNIKEKENSLRDYLVSSLKKLPYITLYLTNDLSKHSSVVSFNIKGVHAHDTSSLLDSQNVCVRAGNHCAQPLMRFLGVDSTCRVSLSFYNDKEDIDKLLSALNFIYEKFKKYIKI